MNSPITFSIHSSLSVAGPSDLSDVVFRIVDQTRYTEVLDLLYSNFHTDEPMSRALKIFDGTNRIPEADDYTLRALAENLSLMAVDSITNKLLGVSVNGVVKKGSFPLTKDQVTYHIFKHFTKITGHFWLNNDEKPYL